MLPSIRPTVDRHAHRGRPRVGTAILFSLVLISCGKLDRVLEGPAAIDARISVAVESESVTIPAGNDLSMAVTLSRIGDFTGPVVLTLERIPDGMTAVLENEQTTGQTTTATLRLHADSSARVGTFSLGLRGRADRLRDATLQMTITIVPTLTYGLSVSVPGVTIARGGIARISAVVARTNYTLPVALSLGGVTGISAIFDQSPLAGTTTPFTIAVAPTVAAGTYSVSVRGTGSGITDRNTTLTVHVTDDPLQLVTGAPVTAPQVSTRSAEVIVNRGAQVGAVTLTAENLPTGVTASVLPIASGAVGTTVSLNITSAATPGTSRITLRARAAGVPDATANLDLTVTEARIEFKPVPPSVEIFQGTTVKSSITIERTDYPGDVAFTVADIPSGLAVSVLPSPTVGDTIALSVSAASTMSAGTYTVALRAMPSALAVTSARVASVQVVVREASNSGGNVLLDWSRCEAPGWVAGQDGTGPWLRLDPVAGTFRFSVTQTKGGFAFATPNAPLTVRYLMHAELTSRPIDMCPPALGTKIVLGRADHTAVGQTWAYRLGGGSGTSTPTSPNFSIIGVRPGVHDFIGWSQPSGGFRAVIRRDLDIPDGASLADAVDLTNGDSFGVTNAIFPIVGVVNAGESLTHSMTYLTRNNCTVNELYASSAHGFGPTVFGIPAQMQRPDDYHHLTVISAGASVYRSVSTSFQVFQQRTMTLPPVTVVPTVFPLAGPYKRLQASLGALPAAYNGTVELRYNDGVRTVLVQASSGYIAAPAVNIVTPDLSGVAGFPLANSISPSSTVLWTVTLNGGDETSSLCTQNRTSVLARRSGSI